MARRSHPPSLVRSAERTLLDHRLVRAGDVLVAACSGGPDSTALLHVLARLRERLGFSLVAHGVDHGLRPEAASELELAEALARSLDVPWSVSAVRLERGSNLQSRARTLRFAELVAVARGRGAAAIATGHTLDDRAETVLLRLLRGSGPRGLAALPPSGRAPGDSGMRLVRPLIAARRSDVLAHLTRHRIAFADDPSNVDPRFLRVRVRRELVPLLEELAPGVVAHLGALSDMLAEPGERLPGPLLEWGRAQRLAVRRAQRLGERSIRLRLRGGREVNVTFPDDGIVLIEDR